MIFNCYTSHFFGTFCPSSRSPLKKIDEGWGSDFLLYLNGWPSKNMGKPPKPSILIGFSIIFTIHFGVPLFLETSKYVDFWNRWILDAKHAFRHAVKHHIHTLFWDKPSGQGQTLLFKHVLGYFSFWYNGSNDISWFFLGLFGTPKTTKKMANLFSIKKCQFQTNRND